MIRNWFGMEPHFTDDFISWRDRDPAEKAEQLRKAYDTLMEYVPAQRDNLRLLLDSAYRAGRNDELDDA